MDKGFYRFKMWLLNCFGKLPENIRALWQTNLKKTPIYSIFLNEEEAAFAEQI